MWSVSWRGSLGFGPWYVKGGTSRGLTITRRCFQMRSRILARDITASWLMSIGKILEMGQERRNWSLYSKHRQLFFFPFPQNIHTEHHKHSVGDNINLLTMESSSVPCFVLCSITGARYEYMRRFDHPYRANMRFASWEL